MTRDETVALSMLVTLGLTAMESGGIEDLVSRFEAAFGVELTNASFEAAARHVRDLLGSEEQVVID